MFSYIKWRVWLEAKVTELRTDDVVISLQCGHDDGPKPGLGFGIEGLKAIGLLENWITGETDYTIHALPSGEMILHDYGLILTDDTFEEVFEKFIFEFQKHNL